ncbi:hypothetical protein K1Y79_10895 [Chitinophaga sp. B61]|uniref:NUMOD1 domain-containing protein n=1 Tax=Chitinophaga rhizophila TaxID=2866212 RepID=A0ABS7GAZ0_9BACT|nr:hypothetical protein [Chitinophaga rhizophila]
MQIKNKSAWRKNYAVANRGRVISCYKDLSGGKLLSGSVVEAIRYEMLNQRTFIGPFTCRKVAKLFNKKPGRNYRFVIYHG